MEETKKHRPFLFNPQQKPTSAPSAAFFQRKEGECPLPVSSFRAKARNLFRSRSSNSCEGSGERETPSFMRLGITVLHAD